MSFSETSIDLFVENLLFVVLATFFLIFVGWVWRESKPFYLPETLPGWFKIWFSTVQLLGGLLPLVAMIWWGVWQGYSKVLMVLISYFIMLGLQILSEILTLRWFHSVVWVMVPYLYLPYRIWQLYQGLTLLSPETELIWLKNLLLLQIVVWSLNYCLDLSQLPRLLCWEAQQED
ncbi:hypothetical protein [Lyngbya aestuarii]|uniref:hypothetical protein n=1 Tax=Lyngbya aestuarii TaxID=118322 RepID=UPI00403DBA7C